MPNYPTATGTTSITAIDVPTGMEVALDTYVSAAIDAESPHFIYEMDFAIFHSGLDILAAAASDDVDIIKTGDTLTIMTVDTNATSQNPYILTGEPYKTNAADKLYFTTSGATGIRLFIQTTVRLVAVAYPAPSS